MTGGADADKEHLPTVCQFEDRRWKHQYIVDARKIVKHYSSYRFFWFFPDMNTVDLKVSFVIRVHCLLEYYDGYNVTAPCIWCTAVAVFAS